MCLSAVETDHETSEIRERAGETTIRLCHLQRWVKETGLRVVIVFEGRDGAGKGGTIRALTERLSPRVFKVIALPAPSDREKSQVFLQRYLHTFRRLAKWSSSIGAGTTARASNS